MNKIKAFINKLIEPTQDRIIIDDIKDLSRKYINGLSTDEDLLEWELVFKLINENINKFSYMPVEHLICCTKDLFLDYKIKHYPNKALQELQDMKLFKIYQKCLYRKMIILALGEILRIICRWDFNTKEDYQKFISYITEYVYYPKKNKWSKLYETQKCTESNEEELLNLLRNLRNSYQIQRRELQLWEIRVENLKSFKYENLNKIKLERCSSKIKPSKRKIQNYLSNDNICIYSIYTILFKYDIIFYRL